MKKEEHLLSIDYPALFNVRQYLLEMLSELQPAVVDSLENKEAAIVKFSQLKISIVLDDEWDAYANPQSVGIKFSIGILKAMSRDELKFVMGHELYHVFYHEHGLRVEENLADMHSVKWLIASGTAPEAGMSCIRKLAENAEYKLNSGEFYGRLINVHSPYELRVQHMGTYLGSVNQFGETEKLSVKNQIINPTMWSELEEALKKKPTPKDPNKNLQLTLNAVKQELENVTDNFDKLKFCLKFKAVKVKQSDVEAMKFLHDLADTTYLKYLNKPETWINVYQSINYLICDEENHSLGLSNLLPMAIFKKHQKFIREFSETNDLEEKRQFAVKINTIVKRLENLHKALFSNHASVSIEVPKLWVDDAQQDKVVLEDNSHQIALAYWNLGVFDKNSVLTVMLTHYREVVRQTANEPLYQYFAFLTNNTVTIGKIWSEDHQHYRRIKNELLKPRLVSEAIATIEANKTEFVQTIKNTNFRSMFACGAFHRKYLDALRIYKVPDDPYTPGVVYNVHSTVIDLLLNTFQEMVDTGILTEIEKVKGFYNHIVYLLSDNHQTFVGMSLRIPGNASYSRFLVSNSQVLGAEWIFPLLYEDYSYFSPQDAGAGFAEMAGINGVKSLSDFQKVINFYSALGKKVKHIPDLILKSLLQSLSDHLSTDTIVISDPESVEGQAVLWLLKFLRENITIKNFQCTDVKHELLKDKIHWNLSKDGLNIRNYQKISFIEFVNIFLMYDKTFSFPDIATRDFLGNVMMDRLGSLELKDRMAWLDHLVVKNSLSDHKLRKRMITLLVNSFKEMIDTLEVNKAKTIDQFSSYLIEKVSRRDLILILDELTSVLQSQMEECQIISQKLQRSKIQDNPETHAKLTGAEALVRFVTLEESTRLEFIKFLLDPVTGASTEKVATTFMRSPHQDSLRKLIESMSYLGGRDMWNELRSGEFGSQTFISEKYQKSLLISLLYDFHIQYHDFPMEVKAVLMSYILIPGKKLLTEKDSLEAYHSAMNYVVDRLLSGPQYTDAERSFFRIYIDTAPAHTRQLLLSGMLAATHANNQLEGPPRLGEMIAMFCEHMGPAEAKIAQAIHSNPNTPADIKKDLAHVKSRFKMPTRWEISDRIMVLDPKIRANISHMGHRLGSASYNMALQVIYQGKEAVLLLPRENSVKMASYSFSHLHKVFRLWAEDATPFKKKVSNTMRAIIQQTSKALVHETNYTMSVFQESIATQLYDQTIVTIGNHSVHFNTMKTIIYDQHFRLLQQATGVHFNDLPSDSTARKTVATAVAIVEIRHLLRGHRFDPDRHGAQMRVQQFNDSSYQVGLFDFGEVIVDLPLPQDITQLAEAIPYMMGDLMLPTMPNVSTFQHFVDKKGSEHLSHYVTRAYRSLLALQDYLQELTMSDLLQVVQSVLTMPDLNPQLRESLSLTLIQLKHAYFGQQFYSPLLASIYSHFAATNQPTVQFTSTLAPHSLPERPFSKYSRGHTPFFSQSAAPNVAFSMDAIPERFYPTGEPTWKIKVEITFENNTSVNGTAKFYGTPMLCRSQDATQINLIDSTGPFKDFVHRYNMSNIQDICSVLPPSKFDLLLNNMQTGAFLGTFRAAGKLTEWAFATKASDTVAFCAGKSLYYSCYFAYEVSTHMIQNADNLYDWTTPVVKAATNTVWLLGIDTGFALASNVCGWVSKKTVESGPRISSITGFFGRHLSKFAVPYQMYQQGVSAVLGSMGASMATEEIICHAANKAGMKKAPGP